MNFNGLLQSYEVVLIIALFALANISSPGGDALDVEVETAAPGSLLSEALSDKASFTGDGVEFGGKRYVTPTSLSTALQHQQLFALALETSADTSATELMRWLAELKRAGISIQLMHNGQ